MTMKNYHGILTASNILTCMRLALVPIVFYAIQAHAWIPAMVIFTIAAVSDLLDGELARRWNEQTAIGTYLDPIADKVLLLSSYYALHNTSLYATMIPRWFVIFFMVKELLLIMGACVLGLVMQRLVIKPVLLGKIAMVLQSLFVGCVLLSGIFPYQLFFVITSSLLPLLIVITIAAALHYFFIGVSGIVTCLIK